MTETLYRLRRPATPGFGPLAEVALAVKRAEPRAAEPIAIFSDVHRPRGRSRPARQSGRGAGAASGRGGASPLEDTAPTEPRGRGRPRLGVVAREVTLLAAPLGMAQRPARRRVGRVAQAGRRGPPLHRRPGSPARGARRRLSFHVGDGRQSAALRGSLARLVRRRSAPLRRPDRDLASRHSRPCRQARLSAIMPDN